MVSTNEDPGEPFVVAYLARKNLFKLEDGTEMILSGEDGVFHADTLRINRHTPVALEYLFSCQCLTCQW